MLQQRAGLPTPSGPVPAVAPAESQQREATAARVEIAEVGYAEIGKLTSKRVRLWLSAGGNEPVASGGLGRSESLFTKHFLATLHDSEGIMDSHEIFSSIHERMKGAPESQMPELSPLFTAKHGGGQFLFVKKTWSADDIDSRLGRVTVRVVGNGGQAYADRASLVKDLVIEQLRQSDGDSPALRPDAQPRPLFIAVSFTQRHDLELTLVDRETLQVLGKVFQALATDPEDLANNVAAALLTLRRRAEKELQGKEISVDIVKRALVAQRTQTWDYHLTIGVSAYVDLDGGGLLNEPAGSVRMGANRNLTPWFLLGAALGFDWTKAKSSRQSVIGDLDDGTYSNNRLTGQLTLHTYSAMLRATFRQSHGLVLPFVYVSAGVAGLDADLTDEHIKPATPSDTLPLDLINRRDVNDALAFAWETGLGLNFLVTEGVSFVGEAHFFKAHHEMRISSQIEGVNEASVLRTDFPSVQAASARAGVGFLF
jgi:opacity protein-like surface antigen